MVGKLGHEFDGLLHPCVVANSKTQFVSKVIDHKLTGNDAIFVKE